MWFTRPLFQNTSGWCPRQACMSRCNAWWKRSLRHHVAIPRSPLNNLSFVWVERRLNANDKRESISKSYNHLYIRCEPEPAIYLYHSSFPSSLCSFLASRSRYGLGIHLYWHTWKREQYLIYSSINDIDPQFIRGEIIFWRLRKGLEITVKWMECKM